MPAPRGCPALLRCLPPAHAALLLLLPSRSKRKFSPPPHPRLKSWFSSIPVKEITTLRCHPITTLIARGARRTGIGGINNLGATLCSGNWAWGTSTKHLTESRGRPGVSRTDQQRGAEQHRLPESRRSLVYEAANYLYIKRYFAGLHGEIKTSQLTSNEKKLAPGTARLCLYLYRGVQAPVLRSSEGGY